MTIMTLCGVCSPIYSELLEPILIEPIEGTYGEHMAASSCRGSCGNHSGYGGYSRGHVPHNRNLARSSHHFSSFNIASLVLPLPSPNSSP